MFERYTEQARREIDACTARRIVTAESNDVPFSDEATDVPARLSIE